MTDELGPERLRWMYRQMLRIREFEERVHMCDLLSVFSGRIRA